MKRPIQRFSFFLLTACISLQVMAGGDQSEKKKSYSKSYSVSSSDKISLTNSFGELKINTWEKNEVKVDVTITGKGNTDERAQEILDRISIEDGKNSSGVYFKTNFKDDDREWKKGDKNGKEEGMEINYVVFLPAGNPLDASNSFGPMSVPDIKGPAELESKFGKLTAGKISNNKSIVVEFGKATIDYVNGGKVTIKFSRATINMLTGSVDTKFEFCDVVKLTIDNTLKDLNIKNSYSSVYLDMPKNISASFDIKTSFGDFKNKSDFKITEEKDDDKDHYGPKFDHQYNGSAGSGAAKIRIKSDFGKVVAGHDLIVEEKDKKNKEVSYMSVDKKDCDVSWASNDDDDDEEEDADIDIDN
jgi:hypothetical protein